MSMNEMTPADFAAVCGNNNNDAFGGNGAWWILLLFLFGWGRGGYGGFGNGGGCGGDSCATQADVRAAVDQQTLIGKLDRQTYGIADATYALNNTITGGFASAELSRCNQQAALMAQMEDQDYGRYRDQLSDYYTELGLLTDDARYQAEQDYGRWADHLNFTYGQYSDDRAYDYQTGRDAVADQQWQAQFDEAKRQYDQQYALSTSKSSSSNGGKQYTGGGYKAPDGWTEEDIENFQCKILDHTLTDDDIDGVTVRLGEDIAKIYGFTLPDQAKNNHERSDAR